MKRSLMLALLLLSAGLAGCVDSDEESSEDEEKEELIKGCMYLSASNYNPDATVDDGSCTFLDSGVIVCDDSNSYTDDIWNSTSEKCEFTARIGESCDDGFSGTEGDAVNEKGECVGTPKDCDDGNPYTDDDWDINSEQCIHTSRIGESCDDGDSDTWNDSITEQGNCVGELVPSCDDQIDGTEDLFNTETEECEYVYLTGSCNDGDPNTIDDLWVEGFCIGEPLNCDDGVVWTNDVAVSGECVNTPIDGMECDDGDEMSRNDVVVDGICMGQPNLLPIVNDVTITPEPAFIDTDLTCMYHFEDDNGDDDGSITYWYIDEVFAGTGPVLSSGQAVSGSIVECQVFANDGIQTGNNISTSITIQNSPPVIHSVELSPDPVNEGEVLTCTVSDSSDADDDSLNFTYFWYVNDVLVVGEQTESFGSFTSGDQVRCEVIADDGEDGSESVVSNTVTVN